ncbi:hypothetical protein AAMO2058_000403800 [Amorphochlora amoebiformis]
MKVSDQLYHIINISILNIDILFEKDLGGTRTGHGRDILRHGTHGTHRWLKEAIAMAQGAFLFHWRR